LLTDKRVWRYYKNTLERGFPRKINSEVIPPIMTAITWRDGMIYIFAVSMDCDKLAMYTIFHPQNASNG